MPRKNFFIFLVAAVAIPSKALACPDGYYNQCFLGACVCLPNSGEVEKVITKPIQESHTQSLAVPLQLWIEQSRNSMIGNSQPLPANFRPFLSRFVSEQDLSRVRYKIGDNGFFNTARNIMNINGNVSAVTLNDVIVFRSYEGANDLALWVHELYHVKQFREWGTRDFSIRYIRDHNGVENPAYSEEARARQVYQSELVQGNQTQVSMPSQFTPVPTNNLINTGIPVKFCRTPAGTCSLPPTMVPMNTPCTCVHGNGKSIAGQAF